MIPVFCFACFLALSSIAIFAPRRAPATLAVRLAPPAPVRIAGVAWPAHVDPRAAGADASVRLALASELGACRGRWAVDTVVAALGEEPDPRVAAALADALASIRAAGEPA